MLSALGEQVLHFQGSIHHVLGYRYPSNRGDVTLQRLEVPKVANGVEDLKSSDVTRREQVLKQQRFEESTRLLVVATLFECRLVGKV